MTNAMNAKNAMNTAKAEGPEGPGSAFDDPDALYRVLVNTEGQYSLWPEFAEVPAGWEPVHGAAGRAECVEYVERHWTDMRPRTLIVAAGED